MVWLQRIIIMNHEMHGCVHEHACMHVFLESCVACHTFCRHVLGEIFFDYMNKNSAWVKVHWCMLINYACCSYVAKFKLACLLKTKGHFWYSKFWRYALLVWKEALRYVVCMCCLIVLLCDRCIRFGQCDL